MSVDATAASAFRRLDHVPEAYSPGRHAARTLLLASVIGAGGLYFARSAIPLDWLFLPAFVMAANAIEWAFHRGPMHRPLRPRVFYHNHALLHHRAFVHDRMEVADLKELGLVMMPWYTMLLLFVLASPLALVASALRGPPVAGIFYLAAAAYFVMYETMHALYHVPASTLRRLGLGGRIFSALQAHHRQHHRPNRMAFVNFNVTFPLTDWLLRTKEKDGASNGS